MKGRRTTILLSAVLIAITACTSSPTAGGLAIPADARKDAGGTFGSGHVTTPPPGEESIVSSDNTSAEIVPQDTTARGGTFGSGH